MAFNLIKPPPMVTPHRVVMSLRARRCYGWLQSRGIELTTFSTDTMVAGYRNQLELALGEAAVLNFDPAGELPDPVCAEIRRALVADIAAILSRVPEARV